MRAPVASRVSRAAWSVCVAVMSLAAIAAGQAPGASPGAAAGGAPDAVAIKQPAPVAGFNVISVGNRYADPIFTEQQIGPFLASIRERGVNLLSVRVTWTTMEPKKGEYDEEIVANLRRIATHAEKNGIRLMLDFHTLFNTKNYAAPPWLAELPKADGSPGVHSNIMIAWSPVARKAYLDMIRHVLTGLKDCKAIEVVSVMNEPWPFWDRGEAGVRSDMAAIDEAISQAADVVRSVDARFKVSARYTLSHNPWSEEAIKRFDEKLVLSKLDVVGLNVYLDPKGTLSLEQGPGARGASWEVFAKADRAIRAAGRELWVTEFGLPMTGKDNRWGGELSVDKQTKYFEEVCERFWHGPVRPSALLVWALQPNPAGRNGFDLRDNATGQWRPAAEVYFRYARGEHAKPGDDAKRP